jgi:hypothetical protein
LTVPVTAGNLYKIRVGSFYGGVAGEGYDVLTLTTTVTNDGCAGAQVVGSGDTPFCTLMANEGSTEDSCAAFADPGPDIWFRHTAECSGTLIVSTCNQADYNTKLAIYEGCGVSPPFFLCNLNTLLACNDNDLFCPGGTSKLTVPVTEGMCYRIRLGGANNESGTGTLTLGYIGCTPPNPCPADIAPFPDGDGNVNVDDLLAIINSWGTCANPNNCPADISPAQGNDVVNVDDLLAVINNWGPCP